MRMTYIAALACSAISGLPSSSIAQERRPAAPERNPVLMKAADVLGMVRGVNRSTDLLNSVQFRATGTESVIAPDGTKTDYTITRAVVGYGYFVPSGRVDFQRKSSKGTDRVIRVVAGDKAWDEVTPGVGKAMSNDRIRRLADVYISPQGAIRAAADADPAQVRYSMVAGKDVIVTPAGPFTLTITLNAANEPEQVATSIPTDKGPVPLVAIYSGYKDWDGYDVKYPTRIVHRVNGVQTLSLTVTELRSNPYVVFPIPAELAAR